MENGSHAGHPTVTDSLSGTKSVDGVVTSPTQRKSPAVGSVETPSWVSTGPTTGLTRRGASGQSRPSLAAQPGHWPQPDWAWSFCARRVCSAAEFSDGRPEPPIACQVSAENWYRP